MSLITDPRCIKNGQGGHVTNCKCPVAKLAQPEHTLKIEVGKSPDPTSATPIVKMHIVGGAFPVIANMTQNGITTNLHMNRLGLHSLIELFINALDKCDALQAEHDDKKNSILKPQG